MNKYYCTLERVLTSSRELTEMVYEAILVALQRHQDHNA